MYKLVKEGFVKFSVDTAEIVSKDLDVFYNPKMELNRNITIRLLENWEKNNLRVALPLAGTGIRAIRMLKELSKEKIENIFVNDLNPTMKDSLSRNLELNELDDKKLTITVADAKTVFSRDNGFDYIDIDPFGSPNPLLDGAIQKISGEGILAITATDTAALAGTYPKTGIRKYWAKTFICPQKHEIGLRALCRKVQLIGLQYNKALIPILSYHFEHYYRIFFKVVRSKKECNEIFENFGEVGYERKSGAFGVGVVGEMAGPLYLGLMQDSEMINRMSILMDEKSKEHKLLIKLVEENIDVVGYYDLHDVCEKNKLKSIGCNFVIEGLAERDFDAVRVHTNNYGIKTKASIKDIVEIIKSRIDDK